jgi:nucleoside-diphosphate-sugar epimerase
VKKFRRAVATGGAGFLGSLLCRRLLEAGTEVVCLDSFLTGSRAAIPMTSSGARPQFWCCDVTEPFDVTGSSSPIRYVPRPEDDPNLRKPDISLARAKLGFEPRIGWEEGLPGTLAWSRRFTGPAAAQQESREDGPVLARQAGDAR